MRNIELEDSWSMASYSAYRLATTRIPKSYRLGRLWSLSASNSLQAASQTTHTGRYHALIGAAAKLPIPPPTPIISFSPVVFSTPNRPVDLQLRATFPPTTSTTPLPMILLSHGHGRSNYLSSLEGYALLYEFWAAHGFAVLQPTHLTSALLGLQAPFGQELWWQERAEDMVRLLDDLDGVEAAVPGLKSRLDLNRVAVVGHSPGSRTASMLLGASNTDPRDGTRWYKPEQRIKAGVVLAGLGNGGADLSERGNTRLAPFYRGDFSRVTTPALVVYGDEDVSPHLTTRGADWHADQYTLAPGENALLVLKGAKHGLGGISGLDEAENREEESPERLAAAQRMTWAYSWSRLYEGDAAWEKACEAFEGLDDLGSLRAKVESPFQIPVVRLALLVFHACGESQGWPYLSDLFVSGESSRTKVIAVVVRVSWGN